MKRILTALGFLTIIPLGRRAGGQEMAKSVPAFPAVGLIQGGMLAAASVFLGNVYTQEITAALVVLLYVISSGGFHLDGLSDTFDALAKRGSREEKLAVMKDGSAGAIGASAVVFSILIKYLSLKDISHFTYYILLMPVFSKWAMVMAMSHGKPAREEGLGRIFVEGAGLRAALASTAGLLLIVFVSAGLFEREALLNAVLFGMGSMAALYIFSLGSVMFSRRSFGGLTGDTLGAVSEVSEMIYLLMAVAWQRLYI